MHTPERLREYLQNKMSSGTKARMLLNETTEGIIPVTGDLIGDLYVLPEMQNRGYETDLLQFAIKLCTDTPAMPILENNTARGDSAAEWACRQAGRKDSAKALIIR